VDHVWTKAVRERCERRESANAIGWNPRRPQRRTENAYRPLGRLHRRRDFDIHRTKRVQKLPDVGFVSCLAPPELMRVEEYRRHGYQCASSFANIAAMVPEASRK